MKVVVRFFREEDAEQVSNLVRETLFTVNTKDYEDEALETVASWYTPQELIKQSKIKAMYVAESDGKIVGTASLQDDHISGVFVARAFIKKGVGTMLMETVEKDAFTKGFHKVKLASSLTAHAFYKKLGYVNDEVGKLGIDMHKDLT